MHCLRDGWTDGCCALADAQAGTSLVVRSPTYMTSSRHSHYAVRPKLAHPEVMTTGKGQVAEV